jgi:hypothetical protein
LHIARAAASCGRSLRLPLSTSVNSTASVQLAAVALAIRAHTVVGNPLTRVWSSWLWHVRVRRRPHAGAAEPTLGGPREQNGNAPAGFRTGLPRGHGQRRLGPALPEDCDAQRDKESPGLSNRGSKWVMSGGKMLKEKNPQTPRSYPKAQIRQGADRVSAPTAGDSNGWRFSFWA